MSFVEGRPVKAGQVLGIDRITSVAGQLDRATSQLSADRKARAETAIQSDEAAVSETRRLLTFTQIRAPISGLAGFRKVARRKVPPTRETRW